MKTFNKVVDFMIKEFNNHNKQLKNILRRGWARKKVYLGDFSLFVQDLRKAVKWVVGSIKKTNKDKKKSRFFTERMKKNEKMKYSDKRINK